MNRSLIARICGIVCVVALSCGLLAGCAGRAVNNATEEQQANRAYMSQINQLMDELNGQLDSFVSAVSRGDVVNMRTQADNAYKTLDSLAELEAPEALADIKTKYVDGTVKLRQAMDAYIELYSEVAGASEMSRESYDERIAEIQALYDEGVDLLQKADESAAGLPE